ncbi:Putative ribonuclease H protein family [Arachis hypogaea]|nr:Putative ribonuclease H protein family [Arachis hypogaea]
MMKVGWGLMEQKDSLWTRVLRAKYNCENNIIPNISKTRSNPNFWNVICFASEDVNRNFIWCVGMVRTSVLGN